jgi:hypothetical protein
MSKTQALYEIVRTPLIQHLTRQGVKIESPEVAGKITTCMKYVAMHMLELKFGRKLEPVSYEESDGIKYFKATDEGVNEYAPSSADYQIYVRSDDMQNHQVQDIPEGAILEPGTILADQEIRDKDDFKSWLAAGFDMARDEIAATLGEDIHLLDNTRSITDDD